jgi:hypothetical protein
MGVSNRIPDMLAAFARDRALCRLFGALLTALLFAALYIVWSHYPHGIVLPSIK